MECVNWIGMQTTNFSIVFTFVERQYKNIILMSFAMATTTVLNNNLYCVCWLRVIKKLEQP